MAKVKCELYHDHFENHKRYPIQKAQLIIADIPYNLGNNAYASNPGWYKDGDNKNGESKLAGTQFFDTDKDFKDKIHPTQKPLSILKRLIEIFTDEGDVVIDPVAGSGSTLLAAKILGRNSYGFEIKKDFYVKAIKNIDETKTIVRGKTTFTQIDIFDI